MGKSASAQAERFGLRAPAARGSGRNAPGHPASPPQRVHAEDIPAPVAARSALAMPMGILSGAGFRVRAGGCALPAELRPDIEGIRRFGKFARPSQRSRHHQPDRPFADCGRSAIPCPRDRFAPSFPAWPWSRVPAGAAQGP